MSDNEILEKKILKISEKLDNVSGSERKLSKLIGLKGKISQKALSVEENYKFFNENKVCPTCTQTIEDEIRLNKIDEAQNKLDELEQAIHQLEDSINEEKDKEQQFNLFSKEIFKLNNDISQNNTRISLNQRQIRDLENEVQKLTSQLKNRNSEHEKLEEYEKTLQNLFDDLVKKKENLTNYEFVYSLLKDDGVKTKIIKKYLPFVNQQINRYLQMMDFYINFYLDEEFNEIIKSPIHEDFSYSSFSEGEKMRIDLALLFTWREVAKVKNSASTNLLIMDEVFDSSLDGFGTDEFLKIIRYVIKDANIFVISHKTGLEDKFESVIRFDKLKGFSRIVS
jgi:DNA repair exonuclease SbcCD ATPase subunit